MASKMIVLREGNKYGVSLRVHTHKAEIRNCGAAVQSLPKKSSRSREMQPDPSELQLGTALIRKCYLDEIVVFLIRTPTIINPPSWYHHLPTTAPLARAVPHVLSPPTIPS